MTKFKDFGSGPSLEGKEPISFMLHGESFDCRKELQGKVLLDLVARSDGKDPAASAQVINDFFNNVLLPESYTRFNKLLSDPDKIVSVEMLGNISSWLVETYSSRPEQEPEVS